MKNFIFLFSLVLTTLVSFTVVSAQAFVQQEQNPQRQSQQHTSTEEQSFSEAELAQMLAPIALYPDSLLTHILIAATYPIEIVEAHRWLKKNEKLNAQQAAQSVKSFAWDASVKALVPFERILSRLSENLSWTQQLGDAFLQDEGRLLESIQVLREQAKLAGNLDKMDNMAVSYEDSNIIIEAREKEIVYVPYYDTRMVYGAWHWSSYPPVYWTPYRSVYVSHYSPFYWHSGIHISFNYFFSAFHWHNRHVVVVNPYRAHHRYYHQRPRRLIAHGGYAKRWVHQPTHRKGVAYRSKHTSKKYHSNRVKVYNSNKSLHFGKQNKMNTRAVVKQYSANIKAKEHSAKEHKAKVYRTKALSAKKQYRSNVNVKKASSQQMRAKTYRKSANKHKVKHGNMPVRKQRHNTNRKQKHQKMIARNHRSKATKAHYK